MPDGSHFPPADPRNLVVNVLRTDDLLALQFEFVNLHLDTRTSQEARLARTQFGQPAFIIVRFPPQHVAEQAFFLDTTGGPPPDPVPVKALFSGPSRLVFKLPDEVEGIPYTLDSLLDWAKLEPEVAPNALPLEATDGPGIMPLDETVTAVELPFRLFLSPDKFGRWAHKVPPQTFNGRTELWHTRLGTHDSNRLRRRVHLDVIRFKYEDEDELGAPSPRGVGDVDFEVLEEAVLRAYNEHHGEAVGDFQGLVRSDFQTLARRDEEEERQGEKERLRLVVEEREQRFAVGRLVYADTLEVTIGRERDEKKEGHGEDKD